MIDAREPSDPPSGPLQRGARVADRWVVDQEIGRGASGTVYRAVDEVQGGAEVALKVIHRERCGDPQVFARFRREAKILERLKSPHVVPILDCATHDGLVVLALELSRGRSLEAMLEGRPGGLPTTEAVEIARQLGEALAVAHAAGIVHRDLKPANVVVEEAAAGRLVRILDFGLAKVIYGEQQMTAITDRGMIFGTPEYMAPEQARGEELDERGDVYALGVVLYEMLSGRVPFQERTAIATMTAHLTQEVPPLRERGSAPPSSDHPVDLASHPVPRALEAVVLRALAKHPAERWPSARAFVDALLAARDERRFVAGSRADAVELGETVPADGAGALRRSQVMRAAAEHARRNVRVEAPAAAAPAATEPRAEPLRPWIVMAILLALLCVGVGALVGAR